MQALFNLINIPLGFVMRFLANIFSNDFAAAVAIFTLLINVVMIPISIKSQKSAVSQMRIKPKMDELKKRFGDDRQKLAQAQQQLYQDEGVSMSGGCLPMLIRMLIMFSIYYMILSPLTYIANVDSAKIDNVYNTVNTMLTETKKSDEAQYNKYFKEFEWSTRPTDKDLVIVKNIRKDGDVFKEVLPEDVYKKIEKDLNYITEKDSESNINFNLFGNKNLDLTETPDFSFNIFKDAKLLWIIPIGAFLAQIVTSLISMKVNKINNPDAPSMMGMMLTMPLISLFIGFGLPAGVGFYWICSSLIGGLMQSGVQLWYGPNKMLARERSKELCVQCDFEAKQIGKFDNTDKDSIIKE